MRWLIHFFRRLCTVWKETNRRLKRLEKIDKSIKNRQCYFEDGKWDWEVRRDDSLYDGIYEEEYNVYEE